MNDVRDEMNRQLAGLVTRIALSITDQNTDVEMIRALSTLANEVNQAPSGPIVIAAGGAIGGLAGSLGGGVLRK